jgi:hypothetical protein
MDWMALDQNREKWQDMVSAIQSGLDKMLGNS